MSLHFQHSIRCETSHRQSIMKRKSIAIIFVLAFLVFSCQHYTPKPIGYNRIEPIPSEDKEVYFSSFTVNLPSIVRIDTLRSPQKGELWFNIVYPDYGAMVYCTYLPIHGANDLSKAIDDSYQMAYSHTLKADKIDQRVFDNTENKVSGIVYQIGGSVATPIQFFATDSTKHFLRGSFYYSDKVNTDSVAPVTEFITKDIERMIESLRWRK